MPKHTVMGSYGLQQALPVFVVDQDGSASGSQMSPLGYRQMSVNSQSASAVADVPVGSKIVLVKIEGGSVRYRDDGVAPTSEVGMPLSEGESMTYDASLEGIQIIAQSGTAVCNMAFYGAPNG